MAFCSNSGFGRLVDTDVIYTGPSITCGGTTVNPGDTVREFLSVVFLCSNDIVVDVEGNSLPIPDGTGIKVAFVGPGTYTQSGGPDVVVPSGHMGILNWDGSVWYLGSSVELPDNSAKIAEWDAGTYEQDEVVTVDGVIYRAKEQTIEEPPSGKWDMLGGEVNKDLFVNEHGGRSTVRVGVVRAGALSSVGNVSGTGMVTLPIRIKPYDEISYSLPSRANFNHIAIYDSEMKFISIEAKSSPTTTVGEYVTGKFVNTKGAFYAIIAVSNPSEFEYNIELSSSVDIPIIPSVQDRESYLTSLLNMVDSKDTLSSFSSFMLRSWGGIRINGEYQFSATIATSPFIPVPDGFTAILYTRPHPYFNAISVYEDMSLDQLIHSEELDYSSNFNDVAFSTYTYSNDTGDTVYILCSMSTEPFPNIGPFSDISSLDIVRTGGRYVQTKPHGYLEKVERLTSGRDLSSVGYKRLNRSLNMVSHAGYTAMGAAQNSLQAFELSIRLGYKFIEMDVQITKDNRWVLLHDATIPAGWLDENGVLTTEPTRISEVDYDTITKYTRPLSVGSPHKILGLVEFLSLCRDNGITPQIEPKVGITRERVKYLIDEVSSVMDLRDVMFIHGDIISCRILKDFAPFSKISRYSGSVSLQMDYARIYGLDVYVNTSQLQGLVDNIDEIRAKGVETNIWTVDNLTQLNKCIDIGLDYINTHVFIDDFTGGDFEYYSNNNFRDLTLSNATVEAGLLTLDAGGSVQFDQFQNDSGLCKVFFRVVFKGHIEMAVGDNKYVAEHEGYKSAVIPVAINRSVSTFTVSAANKGDGDAKIESITLKVKYL